MGGGDRPRAPGPAGSPAGRVASGHAGGAISRQGEGAELPGRAGLEAALTELGKPWTGGPFSEPARRELAANADTVGQLLKAFDDLAEHVRRRDAALVISHGEPHPGNLIRAAGRPFLVDWDTVALSPPERDLWMLDDGSASTFAVYSQVAGRALDRPTVSFYRLAWTLADIASFTAQLRLEHQVSRDTEKAWTTLCGLLRAGTSPNQEPWRLAT